MRDKILCYAGCSAIRIMRFRIAPKKSYTHSPEQIFRSLFYPLNYEFPMGVAKSRPVFVCSCDHGTRFVAFFFVCIFYRERHRRINFPLYQLPPPHFMPVFRIGSVGVQRFPKKGFLVNALNLVKMFRNDSLCCVLYAYQDEVP